MRIFQKEGGGIEEGDFCKQKNESEDFEHFRKKKF